MGCVVKVSSVGQGPAGEAIVNTFHYDSGLPGGFPLPGAIATSWEALVSAALFAALTSNYLYVKTRVDIVAGDGTGLFAESFALAGTVGGLAPPSAPMQTAIVIRKLSTLAKKWARGRIFLSPRPTSDFSVNGSVVGVPAGVAALQTAMELSLFDGTSTYPPVIWASALHGSTPVSLCDYSRTSGVRRSRRIRPLS
jgi:hypothetical protein